MFEVGFTEIILILGIALVVLGPEKLPKVAADIGRWIGRARAMARQFKAQLDEEVIKVDKDWVKPEPSYKPKPKSPSGVEDVDVSPNRSTPPPAAGSPDAPAEDAGTTEREAPDAAPGARDRPAASGTDSP